MAETRIQKRTRQANERIEARQCIADIEAILADEYLSEFDEVHQIRLRLQAYNRAVI